MNDSESSFFWGQLNGTFTAGVCMKSLPKKMFGNHMDASNKFRLVQHARENSGAGGIHIP